MIHLFAVTLHWIHDSTLKILLTPGNQKAFGCKTVGNEEYFIFRLHLWVNCPEAVHVRKKIKKTKSLSSFRRAKGRISWAREKRISFTILSYELWVLDVHISRVLVIEDRYKKCEKKASKIYSLVLGMKQWQILKKLS